MSICGRNGKIKQISGITMIAVAVSSLLVFGCATNPAQLGPEIERAQMISQLADDRPPFNFPLGPDFFAGGDGVGSN